jgi:hypothetical protein
LRKPRVTQKVQCKFTHLKIKMRLPHHYPQYKYGNRVSWEEHLHISVQEFQILYGDGYCHLLNCGTCIRVTS